MATPGEGFHRALITTYRVYFAAFLTAALGLAMLLIGHNWLQGHPGWRALTDNVGGLLAGSAAVTMIWELAAKRTFQTEMMSAVGIAEDVRLAGLSRITLRFPAIDWPALFRSARKVDMLFSWANTWRSANREELVALAQRSNAKVRVLLPDAHDERVVAELAARYHLTQEEVRQHVGRAERELREIFVDGANVRATFELWYLKVPLLFGCYRFDGIAVLALFKHRAERGGDVPTLQCQRGGSLFEFAAHELEACFSDGLLARRVYPQQDQAGVRNER